MKPFSYLALCLAALVSPIQAQVQPNPIKVQPTTDFTRTVVDDGLPKPRWIRLYSDVASWPGGVYQWWFNPINRPVNLASEDVLAAFQTAAARWSQMCNIDFQYMGITEVLPDARFDFRPDRVNVWGFSYDYILAGFAPTAVSGTGIVLDADILLSASKVWDLEQIKSIMTHEIGHGLGLGHSDVQSSIMSADPYHDFDYTSILRGDDAAGCAALYGASPNALANRTMNWAEVTYPQAFVAPTAPSEFTSSIRATPAPTQQGRGYIYRYYAVSNSYLAVKDGAVLYMGPDGVFQDVGYLVDFKAAVVAAGF